MRATSPSEFRRYVAIGDSFTAGAPGAAGRWPDELAAALQPSEYHNLGVAGATTAEVADVQLAQCVELRLVERIRERLAAINQAVSS